ncbi:MAG: hypothetical protein H7145_24075 [Akkermansiaceae bacterium]|nr:hypothetical protein [Armatimonadota bacterium]
MVERLKSSWRTIFSVSRADPDQPHTFRNISEIRSRFLVRTTPSGIEAFYRGLNALPAGPPDVAQAIAIASEYGIEILPP